MKKLLLLLIFVLFAGFASAGLIVTPTAMELTVNRGQESVFSLNILNNNSFPIYNVSFSNTSYFSFPTIPVLAPNQSTIASFSVTAPELFNSMFISTISYLYSVPYNPEPKTYVINATLNSFVPSNLLIMQNDSVTWNNLLSEPITINDVGGSGFSTVSLPALASATLNYNVLANYSFFCSPRGYTGALRIVNRSTSAFAHDSTTDVPIIFNVHSVLPANTLQINLVGSLSVNNNQSQVGYLQIINNDQSIVVNGIHVSANKWVSNFSMNDFNLAPSTVSQVSSQLVSFIVQPFVETTAETNRSQSIRFTVTSTNAGNITKNIPVFINYMNMDTININGTTYSITVLGVNATIEACIQHMNDAGFEKCKDLEKFFTKNVTVIKEIEAQYHIGEADLSAIKAQLKSFGDVSQRLENKMNLYVDKQDSIMALVKNNSDSISAIQQHELAFEAEYKAKQDKLDSRFWVSLTIVGIIFLIAGIIWIVANILYFDALEDSLQLGGL